MVNMLHLPFIEQSDAFITAITHTCNRKNNSEIEPTLVQTIIFVLQNARANNL